GEVARGKRRGRWRDRAPVRLDDPPERRVRAGGQRTVGGVDARAVEAPPDAGLAGGGRRAEAEGGGEHEDRDEAERAHADLSSESDGRRAWAGRGQAVPKARGSVPRRRLRPIREAYPPRGTRTHASRWRASLRRSE